MTNMDILELFGEARSPYIAEAQCFRNGRNTSEKKYMGTRKLWLLVAAAAALLALSLTAYAAIHARIRLQVTHAERPAAETFDTGADDSANEFWYPQRAPEGYRIYDVSPASDDFQSMEFAKMEESGEIRLIQYVVSAGRDLSDIGQAPHISMVWEDADIAGQPGRTVTIGGHQKALFWKNEAQGFNAMLMTQEMDEDLITMAASVGPGEKLAVSPRYLRQPEHTVLMEQENSYVAFEPWYPQWIPEGYEITYVSDRMYGEQEIHYFNAEGEAIQYILFYRLGSWPRGYEGDREPEEVTISGSVGYLVRNDEGKALYWVDEEKGFGFVLKTGADTDILEIARSVAPGPELPATNAGKTAEALKQLGSYQITALPEGMLEDGTAGWPRENADDWYSYVRRWYISPADNRQIHMEYSTYVLQDSSAQEIACSIAGEYAQPMQINGCTGACSEYEGHSRIVWLDESKGLSFELSSDDFPAVELIQLAASVRQ